MLDQLYPDRKKIRLDPRIYAVQGTICSITICSADRAAVFSDSALAEGCITLLVSRAEVTEVAIHAYCLMPDHLHLLVSPSSMASVLDFIRDYKSRSTRLAWQCGYKGSIWQTSYHDRFLRKDDDVQVAVEYMLNNPVRRGIVAEWRQYPYCGSLVYEL